MFVSALFENSPTVEAGATVKFATYNIHKCRGIDGQLRPERIVAVLQEIDADIIALQEVLSARNASDQANQANFLADALKMNCITGHTVTTDTHEYGNIILTRLPIEFHRNHNISVNAREPRGCLQADVRAGNSLIHVFNTHFGLSYEERVYQAQTLFQTGIVAANHGPRVLLGDFNDWFPGRASRYLRTQLHDPSRGILWGWRKRTHPCLLPIFKLDKIFIEPSVKVKQSYVHRSRLARLASDHLPLVAQIHMPAAATNLN
jgi:endonuclease/exonuclease/phosphatase family metal-dependent hydrolase